MQLTFLSIPFLPSFLPFFVCVCFLNLQAPVKVGTIEYAGTSICLLTALVFGLNKRVYRTVITCGNNIREERKKFLRQKTVRLKKKGKCEENQDTTLSETIESEVPNPLV